MVTEENIDLYAYIYVHRRSFDSLIETTWLAKSRVYDVRQMQLHASRAKYTSTCGAKEQQG